MENKANTAELGLEDLAFLFEIADQVQLERKAGTLRSEVAKKQRVLNLIEQHLEAKYKEDGETLPPKREAKLEPLTPALEPVIETVTPNHAEPVTAPPLPTSPKDGVEAEKTRKTRTSRGSVSSRNNFIKNLCYESQDWLYRDDFEAKFANTEWVKEGDGLREVVRQFLRQARNFGVVIERRAYTLSSHNNSLTPVLLYGLPEFVEPENAEKFRAKFRQKVQDLKLYLTEDEAYVAQKARLQGNQTELITH